MGSTFDSRLSKASGARAQVHLVAKEASNRVGRVLSYPLTCRCCAAIGTRP